MLACFFVGSVLAGYACTGGKVNFQDPGAMGKATKNQNSDPLKSLHSSIAFYVGKITKNENGVTEIKKTIQEMREQMKRSLNTKIHKCETKIKQISQEITALKSCACPDSGKTQTMASPTVIPSVASTTVIPTGPGTGTMRDPYKIATVNDLQKLRTVWRSNSGKYFIVTRDINLSSVTNFTPLPEFKGTLDGNNKKILNLRMDRSQIQYDNYASLFTYIHRGGVVKNLGFENVAIKGNRKAAALASYNYGTVDNCYVTGQVSMTASYGYTGGLVAMSWTGSIIKNSYSTARVSGKCYSGGLVGGMYKATVENSYSSGSVVNKYAGGLVGLMSSGVIRQSYATGSVSGKSYVGGLVGLVNNNPASIIENCYSSGSVSASWIGGGLVGDLRDKVKNSYSSGSVVSKQSRVDRLGVLAGRYGWRSTIINSFGKSQSGVSNTRGQKTDTKLKDPSTFSSWDKNIWKIESGKYPKLKVFSN